MLEETNTAGPGAGNGGADMKGHVSTYSRVIGLLKWGALACAVIAFGVILLISR